MKRLGWGILLLALLFSGHQWLGHVRTLQFFRVPMSQSLFGDIRTLAAAIACEDSGRQVYTDAGCYRGVARYNYPRLWLHVYRWFSQLGDPILLLGRCNAVVLMLSMVMLANRLNTNLPLVLLISPPSLLLMERGNIEGFAFAASFLPLMFDRRIAWLGVLLGFILKLVPAAGLFGLIFVRPLLQNVVLGLGIIILTWLQLDDLRSMLANTPTGCTNAFGVGTLTDCMALALLPRVGMLVAVILGLLFVGAAVKIGVRDRAKLMLSFDSLAWDLFCCSLAIYLIVFICASSWGYRFVFAYPALVVGVGASSIVLRRLSGFGLVIAFLPFMPGGWTIFNALNWVLFLGMALLMLLNIRSKGALVYS